MLNGNQWCNRLSRLAHGSPQQERKVRGLESALRISSLLGLVGETAVCRKLLLDLIRLQSCAGQKNSGRKPDGGVVGVNKRPGGGTIFGQLDNAQARNRKPENCPDPFNPEKRANEWLDEGVGRIFRSTC